MNVEVNDEGRRVHAFISIFFKGPGAGFEAGNELCRAAFDRNCF
jgi:hypothetical protein